MSEIVSAVISWMLLGLGLSYVFQAAQWTRLAKEAMDNPYRYFPLILFIFVVGLTVVKTHNIWTFGWPVVITLLGWSMAIKGFAFLIFPQAMKKFAGWSEKFMQGYIRVSGIILALIGAILVYQYS